MTADEPNRQVAERLGWRTANWTRGQHSYSCWIPPGGNFDESWPDNPLNITGLYPPNYHSRDEIHKLLVEMTEAQWDVFARELFGVNTEWQEATEGGVDECRAILLSTPEQLLTCYLEATKP